MEKYWSYPLLEKFSNAVNVSLRAQYLGSHILIMKNWIGIEDKTHYLNLVLRFTLKSWAHFLT